jgi:hypothetical protein
MDDTPARSCDASLPITKDLSAAWPISIIVITVITVTVRCEYRWMDNVFIERLWRSLKYECVYPHAFETGSELRTGLTGWAGYCNEQRPHSGLNERTPNEPCTAADDDNGLSA